MHKNNLNTINNSPKNIWCMYDSRVDV